MTTLVEHLDSLDRRLVIAASASDVAGQNILALEIRCIAEEVAALAAFLRAEIESRRPLTQRELASNVSKLRVFNHLRN
jgi:hypothetical protein